MRLWERFSNISASSSTSSQMNTNPFMFTSRRVVRNASLTSFEDGQLVRIERREKTGTDPLDSKDESTAIDFIRIYWKEIVEKWVAFFVYKQQVTNTKVNKKIK